MTAAHLSPLSPLSARSYDAESRCALPMEHLQRLEGLLPEYKGHHMAVTVLYVPCSLNIGTAASLSPETHGAKSWYHLITTPYTLQPTPYTQHSAPYTLHSSPHALRPAPCTLHPTPFTLHPSPDTLHPTPSTLNMILNTHLVPVPRRRVLVRSLSMTSAGVPRSLETAPS